MKLVMPLLLIAIMIGTMLIPSHESDSQAVPVVLAASSGPDYPPEVQLGTKFDYSGFFIKFKKKALIDGDSDSNRTLTDDEYHTYFFEFLKANDFTYSETPQQVLNASGDPIPPELLECYLNGFDVNKSFVIPSCA